MRDTQTYGYPHRIVRELMWRDFTRFGSIEAGTNIFKLGGRDKVIRFKQKPPPKSQQESSQDSSWSWPPDRDLLQVWIEGRTGFPFVDSFMRELKATGYCKHIGRLCVGWFLVSDLGLDWRMGGEWFETVLVDYEPCLNWFNWVYACLEPIDKKKPPTGTQQCLEILEGGIQHDPEAVHIKRWIPELSSLPSVLAREPWRLDPQGFQWAPKKTSLRKRMSFIRTSPVQKEHEERGWSAQFLSRLRLSSESEVAAESEAPSARVAPVAASAFQYGVDYPKPIIQPVSLAHAEDAEERTRLARAYAKVEREEEWALLSQRGRSVLASRGA
jgi:hypothetical protein